MNLNDYQKKAHKTYIRKERSIDGLIYTILGLNGESGEVAEKVKKINSRRLHHGR